MRKLIFLLLVIASPFGHALTTLTAQVDRTQAMVGETIVLTITADDNISSVKLDTSALLDDFIVGSTKIRRGTTLINGSIRRQSSWTIDIIGQQIGQYRIPAFTIDGISSAPISLAITKASSTVLPNADILLKTQLSSDNLYVGQQLIYTVKLFIGASLQRAQLQAPQLANAEITQLGEDADSTENLDGRRFRVITRRYSIRPTHAGDVELQGSVFRGDIQLGQRDFFGGGRSKPVTILSDNHALEISTAPSDFPGEWLVSDFVILEQTWPKTVEFKVGEPITRTITLTATNVTKEQLPTVTMSVPDSVQAYPDKLNTTQTLSGDILIAQSVQKIALIPSQSGKVVLPEIKIPWFNAKTKKVEWARIAQQTINVLPAKPPAAQVNVAPTQTLVQQPPATIKTVTVTVDSKALIYWQLACALLLLTSLILLIIIYRSRSNTSSRSVLSLPQENLDQPWVALNTAISQKSHRDVIRLLPLWLMSQHQMTTQQLSLIAPKLHDHYQQLLASHYASAASAAIDQPLNTFAQLNALLKEFNLKQAANTPAIDPLFPNVT